MQLLSALVPEIKWSALQGAQNRCYQLITKFIYLGTKETCFLPEEDQEIHIMFSIYYLFGNVKISLTSPENIGKVLFDNHTLT